MNPRAKRAGVDDPLVVDGRGVSNDIRVGLAISVLI